MAHLLPGMQGIPAGMSTAMRMHQAAIAPPPVAQSVPNCIVRDQPSAFATQIASALRMEDVMKAKSTSHLSLDTAGVTLPCAPPGHTYAIGPRRGGYRVLQPVALPKPTAVKPSAAAAPPAPAPVAIPPPPLSSSSSATASSGLDAASAAAAAAAASISAAAAAAARHTDGGRRRGGGRAPSRNGIPPPPHHPPPTHGLQRPRSRGRWSPRGPSRLRTPPRRPPPQQFIPAAAPSAPPPTAPAPSASAFWW